VYGEPPVLGKQFSALIAELTVNTEFSQVRF
jgi:hypothetical protein